ncbi:hypothetical protein Tco_1371696 [Tanacetum coccineum]
MAISTILISSDSSEESVGTPSGRVLWFGRIPTTVPATTPTIDPPVIHDDTSLIPTKTPTILPITSTIPPIAPATHYTSPFIHTDSSDDDTLNTPLSPTHEIPPVEVAPPTRQISHAPFGVRRRRVTIVSLGQPIPYGRPYRYHPNGPVHMMTARKRVGPLPTYRLAMRHSIDYSLSDHFTSHDSSRDSPSDSSSETSSDSSSDALSDSSSGHSSSDHSSPALPSASHSSFASPFRKWSRPPTTSIPVSLPIPGALSSIRADLLPPCKRIRSSDSVMDLEVSSDVSFESSIPRESSSRVDVDIEVLDDIPEPCQEEGAIEVTYKTLGDLVQRFHDHIVEISVHRVQVIKSIHRDQGHRIVATGQQSVVQSERISELERDNMRLKGMLDVTSKRVTRFQHRELRV